jgi:CheY-like chemotaxis protein
VNGKTASIVVLAVEDEPLLRMYAVDAFEDAGFAVIEAGDAAEALALLGKHPEVSVLFTDIQMPGPLDGMELARQVYERRPDVQIVITSGNIRPSPEEIPDHGSFVPKPYSGVAVADLIAANSPAGRAN